MRASPASRCAPAHRFVRAALHEQDLRKEVAQAKSADRTVDHRVLAVLFGEHELSPQTLFGCVHLPKRRENPRLEESELRVARKIFQARPCTRQCAREILL